MNTSTLASILLESCKTIGVVFSGNSKTYTYKTTTQFEVGDFAIVPSPAISLGEIAKPRVVEVVRVDVVPDLNPSATYDYKWVIQKVNFAAYNQLVSLENTVSEELRLLEQQSLRKKTKEVLIESLGITPTKLNKLINKMNK